MLVKVPRTQEVRYTPGFAYVIKMAWVQYFFALIFWYYVLHKGLMAFLVASHVFETVESSDLFIANISEKNTH